MDLDKRKKTKISTNFCLIADTTYVLLLYLLYATDDMLDKTTYFVGDTLSSLNLYPKVIMPHLTSYNNKNLIKYRIYCLRYRFLLKKSRIFAQDHLNFSTQLIDNLPYSLLEDCPGFFSVLNSHYKPSAEKDGLRTRCYKFLIGRIYNRYGGYNPYCKKRIITTLADKQLFEHLQLENELCNIQEMWDNASDKKKEFVRKIFMLDEQIEHIDRHVIIFSQPLIADCHLSIKEHLALYRPYIDKYGADNIVVKLHPRDNFDYQSHFPGITILQTKAPQQLLSAIGMKFKTAITVCSSAVSYLDEDTEIVWIGAEVDERIIKAYGHVKCPTFINS